MSNHAGKRPPFPYALFVLTALFGLGAVTREVGWIMVACIVGAVLTASAAIYQSRPAKEDPDSSDA